MEIIQISLNISSVVRVLGMAALLLVITSVGGQLTAYLTGHEHAYGLVRLFNVEAEGNIPTAFSAFLLLFAALLLAVIAVLERTQNRSGALHWAVLSFGFLYMSADEAMSFHERWTGSVRNLWGDENLGIFYFAWVIPGIAIVLVLALFFLRFTFRLSARTRLTFLIAATLYIGGAIGVELVGAQFAELHGTGNLIYSMIATVEESLEMGGVIIFVWGLVVFIAEKYKAVQFCLDGVKRKPVIPDQKSI
jgi:hypothetical protein